MTLTLDIPDAVAVTLASMAVRVSATPEALALAAIASWCVLTTPGFFTPIVVEMDEAQEAETIASTVLEQAREDGVLRRLQDDTPLLGPGPCDCISDVVQQVMQDAGYSIRVGAVKRRVEQRMKRTVGYVSVTQTLIRLMKKNKIQRTSRGHYVWGGK